jgi:hypothetical protein
MMMMMMMMMMTGEESMRGLKLASEQLNLKPGDLKAAGLSKAKVEDLKIEEMTVVDQQELGNKLKRKARKQQSDAGSFLTSHVKYPQW